MTKTLISGARIIDGSGSPAFQGSVLIEDDRIRAVSRSTLPVWRSLRDSLMCTRIPIFRF